MRVRCTVCNHQEFQHQLDLGPQPPSNRFLFPKDVALEERYPLSMGMCTNCGTVQLVNRMPIEAIRPRFDWLRNNEPEGHLEDVVEQLIRLPDLGPDASIVGVSYKDRSTLDRLTRRGFNRTSYIDPTEISDLDFVGLETLQQGLSDPGVITSLRRHHGMSNLVVVRHMVEHAESALRFITGLRKLLVPDGYLILEFPDNSRILRSSQHAFIWEEHFSCFTAESFAVLAERADAEVVSLKRYRYPFEDALVAVLRFNRPSKPESRSCPASANFLNFVDSFKIEKKRWHAKLGALRERGYQIAVFGAGHLAVKLINFLNLAGFIDCVIDDHPKKIGLLMPGSQLPIVPSSELATRDIRHCISTLSPESEIRVRQKLSGFFAKGGQFIPAFHTVEETS